MSEAQELALLIARTQQLLQAYQALQQQHTALQQHTAQLTQEHDKLQKRLSVTSACVDRLIVQIESASKNQSLRP